MDNKTKMIYKKTKEGKNYYETWVSFHSKIKRVGIANTLDEATLLQWKALTTKPYRCVVCGCMHSHDNPIGTSKILIDEKYVDEFKMCNNHRSILYRYKNKHVDTFKKFKNVTAIRRAIEETINDEVKVIRFNAEKDYKYLRDLGICTEGPVNIPVKKRQKEETPKVTPTTVQDTLQDIKAGSPVIASNNSDFSDEEYATYEYTIKSGLHIVSLKSGEKEGYVYIKPYNLVHIIDEYIKSGKTVTLTSRRWELIKTELNITI